jgi:hypothetical protein
MTIRTKDVCRNLRPRDPRAIHRALQVAWLALAGLALAVPATAQAPVSAPQLDMEVVRSQFVDNLRSQAGIDAAARGLATFTIRIPMGTEPLEEAVDQAHLGLVPTAWTFVGMECAQRDVTTIVLLLTYRR